MGKRLNNFKLKLIYQNNTVFLNLEFFQNLIRNEILNWKLVIICQHTVLSEAQFK